MTDYVDLHEDYVPFSKASRKADHLFRDQKYGEALQKVEEMWEIVERKLDEQGDD